ncbi:pentapeptide repeat-containing protein [Rhodococcus artemisiae]|uniref:Pentapeptide repeat-containing protein n=1 Tax=Rhodococcus artemisiae TaxID=714159 RepID=A0ABU7LJY7_9NOCA|nr:pentapeptide repeat-containing protein [Rhodococcus artemisiae]MEE2061877.1 pentapeptide repeat-containing protein [Rhodococcus artemisiae]
MRRLPPSSRTLLPRTELLGDCHSCVGLCCTVFGFSRSRDFATDKPAGTPCPHLASDFGCTIHDVLGPRGYRGCTVFDCFGAGQAVTARTPGHLTGAVFPRMKQLHEMLWYLHEAADRALDPDDVTDAADLAATITAFARLGASELLALDLDALHEQVRLLLVAVSDALRASYHSTGTPDPRLHPGAELAGRSLRGRVLCGADLRGACLIGADLRSTDLNAVDLLGADLRDARLDGADLSSALYLTGPQIAAARGDRDTLLPHRVPVPQWARQS